MEDHLGSIEVGKKADMVVFSDNLFEVNRYELYKVKVETTLLNGEVVFNLQ
jgi:predicted amidohydrolase YtcJ